MKSLMVKLLGIGLIFSFNGEVWGADWKYIEEAYAGKYFYDAESIRPSEDIARVWIKVIYMEKAVNYMVSLLGGKYRTLSYAIFLFEYHCGDKKKCVLPIACYSKDGKVLISADEQDFNWNFICPDSIDEALGKILCK
jgi:hypothetical protein